MSAFHDNALIGASGNQGYFLSRSLRFRSSASAYLSRTPASSGNRQIWTWSGWVKRGRLGSSQPLFSSYFASSVYDSFYFNSDDTLRYTYVSSGITYTDVYTAAVFRDPSAWYNIVLRFDGTQSSGNRWKLYVNGTLQTFTGTDNATAPIFNNNNATYIGYSQQSGTYFDGYLAEVNFIDNQSLTQSSFGETSASTGVWIPKKYTGTYGTNGFYLDFKDNSALTTSSNAGLGKDNSGNGNYWTTNNISITSGATYDSMTDVPTLTSPTAANYAVLNPIISASGTVSNGNLTLTAPASNYTYERPSTIAVSTGKWYAEYTVTSGGGGYYPGIGAVPDTEAFGSTFTPGVTAVGYGIRATGEKYNNSTMSAYGVSYTNGDIVGVALDLTNGKIYFSKNGTWMNSGDPSAGTNPAFTGLSGSYCLTVAHYDSGVVNCNFGQRPFAYTPPSGFVALNTFNLPTPTIGATASSQANKYFDVLTWTGDGASPKARTGFNVKPEFVWLKGRSGATDNALFDIVRGTGSKVLESNLTDAENNYGLTVDSFDANGFTTSNGSFNHSYVNSNGVTYVGWAWRANGTGVTNTAGSITSTVSANTTAGFSIVTFTAASGTSNFTVGHGLGVTPSMVIVKSRTNGAAPWYVYHASLATNNYLRLNTTSATAFDTDQWGTGMTSSVIGLRAGYSTVASTDTVAYCFAEVAGYSRFGSYTGNGSTDGPFVFTGFRPRWIMIKRSDASGNNWVMYDTARDTYNASGLNLYANLSAAEDDYRASLPFDILSNGFKLRANYGNVNTSGGTYIFAAFAEHPFKYSLAR